MNDLPPELLNRLFAPSTVYVDIANRLHAQDVSRHDFEKMGEEAVDVLLFDVEVLDLPDEFSSPKTSVSVDHKSRKMMIDAFKELGSDLLGNQADIRTSSVAALLHDLDEKLSILDAPEREGLRQKLEVQPEWMEAVGALHAFEAFIDYARTKRSPTWWSWFLQGAGTPSLLGDEGCVGAMSVISRRYRAPNAAALPDEYAQPWADWALRGKKWKELGVMHAFWLASTLADPEARLAHQFDARGFRFDMTKVDWKTAIIHASNLAANEELRSTHVERFLEKHLQALVRLSPEFARIPHSTELDKDGWSNQSARQLSGKNGLAGLLENVIKLPRRREMVVELQALLLAVDTAPAPSVSRSGPRL